MRHTKFTPVPLTKARTAWGLLRDVKRRVLRAGAAINMADVLVESSETSCGTVGCIAGECCLLTLGRRKALLKQSCRALRNDSRMTFAMRLLGAPAITEAKDDADMDYIAALDAFFDAGTSDGIRYLNPGTALYTRAVGRRIDKFMHAHETRLKRFKLATVFDAAR